MLINCNILTVFNSVLLAILVFNGYMQYAHTLMATDLPELGYVTTVNFTRSYLTDGVSDEPEFPVDHKHSDVVHAPKVNGDYPKAGAFYKTEIPANNKQTDDIYSQVGNTSDNSSTTQLDKAERELKDLWIVGLFPMNGTWPGGLGQLPAVQLGVEDVNKDPTMLPGYKLHITVNNTQVS